MRQPRTSLSLSLSLSLLGVALLGGRASGQALGTWSSPITTWDVMAIHMALTTELFLAENAYLGNYIVSNAIPSNATLTVDGTAPSTDGKRIRLTIETKASRACTMALKLFNWTTSTYDTLGTVSLSANSEQKFEALSADDSDGLNNPYILSSTKKIRARFYYLDSGGSTEFNIFVDAVEFGIR